MRRVTWILGLTLVSCAGPASGQPQPGFHFVGIPTGGFTSQVESISSDGTVAVGWSNGTVPGGFGGFVWTAAQGRLDFTAAQGFPFGSPAMGISGDGTTVVGNADAIPSSRRAYRWRAPGPPQNLGILGGYTTSYSQATNQNGSVVVGRCVTSNGFLSRAFRWSEQGGMQAIPPAPGMDSNTASAVSADGSIVVGYSGTGDGANGEAYKFVVGQGLQILPGLTTGSSSGAYGMNRDGDIVVGKSFGPTSYQPVAWFGDSIVPLGLPTGMIGGGALCVNDDGSVIAGGVGNGLNAWAAVWTPSRGPELLIDYVRAMGIAVPTDAYFTNCRSVSVDGLTFAGEGFWNGRTQGFVVSVPGPGVVGPFVLALAGFLRPNRRRQVSAQAWRAGGRSSVPTHRRP